MPDPKGTVVAHLIDLIGVDAFSQLASAFGGTTIFPPKTSGAASFEAIKEVVGEEAALKLCHEYGGERLYVASGNDQLMAIRNDAIRAEFDSISRDQTVQKTTQHICLKYRLCDRQVRHILKQKV